MFTMFAYMALLLKDFIGASPTVISLLFLCFGVTGVIGNVIGARVMDRIGAMRVGVAAMSCMLLAILCWPLSRGSLPISAGLMLLWGLGCFAINGAQQARLVGMAPSLASASVSLNSSAIYLGQAAGAFLGGVIVSSDGTASLSFYAAAPMALAIVVSVLASNLAERRRMVEAA
jgi:predicted MFS family arabinose efflux permease